MKKPNMRCSERRGLSWLHGAVVAAVAEFGSYQFPSSAIHERFW
jgi:hypothetical protein